MVVEILGLVLLVVVYLAATVFVVAVLLAAAAELVELHRAVDDATNQPGHGRRGQQRPLRAPVPPRSGAPPPPPPCPPTKHRAEQEADRGL